MEPIYDISQETFSRICQMHAAGKDVLDIVASCKVHPYVIRKVLVTVGYTISETAQMVRTLINIYPDFTVSDLSRITGSNVDYVKSVVPYDEGKYKIPEVINFGKPIGK